MSITWFSKRKPQLHRVNTRTSNNPNPEVAALGASYNVYNAPPQVSELGAHNPVCSTCNLHRAVREMTPEGVCANCIVRKVRAYAPSQ